MNVDGKTAYELMCEIDKKNKLIREYEKAIEDIEQLGHILFRLQNNEAIRELNLASSMYEENQQFYQAIGRLSRERAEVQTKEWELRRELERYKVPAKRGPKKKVSE